MKLYTVILALILVGCASTDNSSIPETEKIKSEALVLGKLITNSSNVGSGVRDFDVIVLQNLNTKARYALEKAHNKYHDVSNASISGWLPQGDYKVESLVGFGMIPGSVNFKAKGLGIRFSVQAGQVYDLNTLIFQPLGDGKATIIFAPSTPDDYQKKGAFGNAYPLLAEKQLTEIVLENSIPIKTGESSYGGSGFGVIIDAFISAEANSIHGEEKKQWDEVQTAGELLTLAKHSTAVLNDHIILPDGRVAFGSSLGQILVRSADGVWDNFDIGVHSEITSLLKVHNGLLAATDTGEFYFSDFSLNSWGKLKSELPHGAAIRMFEINNQQVLILIKTGLGLEIRSADSRLAAISEPLQEIAIGGRDFIEFNLKKSAQLAYTSGDKISFLGFPEYFLEYDKSNGSWSKTNIENDIGTVEQDMNSNTVTFSERGLAFRTSYVQQENGDSLTKVKHPQFIRARFASSKKGYALVFDVGLTSVSNHFALTTNGGKKWVEGKELPEGCNDWDVIGNRMICITHSGAILSTEDAKSITLERNVF